MVRAFLVLLVLSTSAFAQEQPQPRCAKFEEARAALAKSYGETPTYAGQTADGSHMIIVFMGAESHSFTIMTLRPDGVSCGSWWNPSPAATAPMPVKPEEQGS